MIIQSSNVGMNTKRSYGSTNSEYMALMTWGNAKNKELQEVSQNAGQVEDKDKNSGNAPAGNSFQESMDGLLARFKETQSISSASISSARSDFHKMQVHSLSYLLSWLFGDKLPIEEDTSGFYANALASQQEFGGHYEYAGAFSESETTSFETTGTAVTADGREINFNLSLTMSRSFSAYYAESIDFGAPQLTDPLVINLDGNSAANVTDQKFFFDLDADGSLDEVSMLGSGSGFLALDKNNDGKINDGNELFGTKNGDGFADLAQYDSDGNGWIDEADPVFSQLKVWTKDANGNDKLTAIGKAGVGAIYLGSADSQFSLNSMKDNSTNAVIRKTGMFLYENGMAGTIQHVDLAKSDVSA